MDRTGVVRESYDEGELAKMMLDGMSAAVTATDAEGNIVYYNDHAAKVFDRRPEYIGRDVRTCHKPESVAMIDKMLAEFAGGRAEEYHIVTGGGKWSITILPLVRDGECVGCFEYVVERRG